VKPVALLVALVLALAGCTHGLRGVRIEQPKATGKVVASASVVEPDGLKVLWNGQTSGSAGTWQGWIAGSPDELDAIWSEAGVGDAPAIDFTKYIVIATAGDGGVCSPRLLAVEAEASGLLRLRYHPDDLYMNCILVSTRIARIVAIPRRVLPATVVFFNGFAFAVPEVPFG
jgi:hypothetical protein